jgi:hypothetical protein
MRVTVGRVHRGGFMIIAASNIAMSGRHQYSETHKVEESLRFWVGNERPDFEGNSREIPVLPTPLVNHAFLSGTTPQQVQPDFSEEYIETSLTPRDRVALKVAEILMKNLTGKDEKINIMPLKIRTTNQPALPLNEQTPPREGWGLEYDSRKTPLLTPGE